jgi:hypothetical protein
MRARILTAITFILLFGVAQASQATGCTWKCTEVHYETGSEATCSAGTRYSTCDLYYDCMGGYCDVWCDGTACYWT